MSYQQQARKPFIALEIYTKEKVNRPKPTSYEYMASAKTQFKDTFTKKKFSIYEFGLWLQEPHVLDKIKSGCTLCVGSVDIDTERPDKFTGSSKERKFVFFFKDPSQHGTQGLNKVQVPPIAQVTAANYSANVPVQEETVKQPTAPKSVEDAWDKEADDDLEVAPF